MDRATVITLIRDTFDEMYNQMRRTTKEIEQSCYEEAAIDGLCKYISEYPCDLASPSDYCMVIDKLYYKLRHAWYHSPSGSEGKRIFECSIDVISNIREIFYAMD